MLQHLMYVIQMQMKSAAAIHSCIVNVAA